MLKLSTETTNGWHNEVNSTVLTAALNPVKDTLEQLKAAAELQAAVSTDMCAADNLDTKFCIEYNTACEIVRVCNMLLNKIDKNTI